MDENLKYVIVKHINNVKIPNHWKKEFNTEEPNELAKNNAIKVCTILFDFVKSPLTISSSIESGIYLTFEINGKYEINIETYNNDDCRFACIINNKRKNKTIYSEDIVNFDFTYLIDKIYELKEEV